MYRVYDNSAFLYPGLFCLAYNYSYTVFIAGHQYYYCATCKDGDFIEWKNTAGVKCDCGQPARKLVEYVPLTIGYIMYVIYRNITRKGPNYKKWFYNCKDDRCDFFTWSKDVEYTQKTPRKRGLHNLLYIFKLLTD